MSSRSVVKKKKYVKRIARAKQANKDEIRFHGGFIIQYRAVIIYLFFHFQPHQRKKRVGFWASCFSNGYDNVDHKKKPFFLRLRFFVWLAFSLSCLCLFWWDLSWLPLIEWHLGFGGLRRYSLWASGVSTRLTVWSGLCLISPLVIAFQIKSFSSRAELDLICLFCYLL